MAVCIAVIAKEVMISALKHTVLYPLPVFNDNFFLVRMFVLRGMSCFMYTVHSKLKDPNKAKATKLAFMETSC